MNVVLPPVPTCDDEKLSFLLEVAHVINTERGISFSAELCDRIVQVRGCYLKYNDEHDEMEFDIFTMDNIFIPAWSERISLLAIASKGDSFWFELSSITQLPIVLFANKSS